MNAPTRPQPSSNPSRTRYRTVCVSDFHLGARGCKAERLCHFLKQTQCDVLYLVGDIIDIEKLQRRIYWPQEHSNVIRRVLTMAKRGTQVVYILGNHDEAIKQWLHYHPKLGNVEIRSQAIHEGLDGRKFLVIHGDIFDGIVQVQRWLYWVGDRAYDLALLVNDSLNWIRERFGLAHWPISRFLKMQVKSAVNYLTEFESTMAKYCKKRKLDGVICGHIHHPEIREIEGISYMNDGDWVESCSALVETLEGRWEILHWNKEGTRAQPWSLAEVA